MQRPHLFRKTGSETFSFQGLPNGQSVLDFWRWSVSDLVSNATRGRLAEFIVGSALGCDFTKVRAEWDPWDLLTPGDLKIEVKSAAYIQSWKQDELSAISFSIKPSRAWDSEANCVGAEPVRLSDVYVFCLLSHRDPATIDPLRLEQWTFYSVATRAVDEYDRSRHSITLPSLDRLVRTKPHAAAGPLGYPELAASVRRHPRRADQP